MPLILVLSENRPLIVWGIVPGHPFRKARLILGIGGGQRRDEGDVDIGSRHLRPVQHGHRPIKRIIAENPGRLEAVIIHYPTLTFSIEVADKDVSP